MFKCNEEYYKLVPLKQNYQLKKRNAQTYTCMYVFECVSVFLRVCFYTYMRIDK